MKASIFLFLRVQRPANIQMVHKLESLWPLCDHICLSLMNPNSISVSDNPEDKFRYCHSDFRTYTCTPALARASSVLVIKELFWNIQGMLLIP